jgi:hypothetical protein
MGSGHESGMGGFLTAESDALGIPLLDVMSEFRRLPAHQVVSMYIAEGQSGPNHFNAQGNALVAETIYRKLVTHPSIAERLFSNSERSELGDIAYSA